jgi:hypothetical protein
MPNATDTQIRATINQFIAEISQLVRQAAVQAVSGALGQGDVSTPVRLKAATRAPTRRKAGRKPGRPKGKRVRRSSADLEAQGAKILAHVRANPGTRMEGLSAAVRTPTKDLRRPIQELIASGQLRTEGQKRGTQYFAGGGGARKKATKKGSRKKATGRKAKRAKRKTAKKAA